jgi:ABC-type uncharacterized transport system fused permease/ATPase subunit
MRENAESIAFYGGEAQEMTLIKSRLDKTIDNSFTLIATQAEILKSQDYRQFIDYI